MRQQGRPGFQDFAQVAQGFSALATQRGNQAVQQRQIQEIDEQDQRQHNVADIAAYYKEHPEAWNTPARDTPELAGYDQRDIQMGWSQAVKNRGKRQQMDSIRRQEGLAESEEHVRLLKEKGAMANLQIEMEDFAGGMQKVADLYNSHWDDGNEAEVITDEEGNLYLQIHTVTGSEPPLIPMEEALEILKSGKLFDPKAHYLTKQQKFLGWREYNAQGAEDPSRVQELENDAGQKVYRIHQIDKTTGRGVYVHYDDHPHHNPEAQVVDVVDRDGLTATKTLEQMQATADWAKTHADARASGALADQREAKTEQIREGGGTEPGALEKNTRFIHGILKMGAPDAADVDLWEKALSIEKSRAGRTRGQFEEDMYLAIVGSGFFEKDKVPGVVKRIADQLFPESQGGGALKGGGGQGGGEYRYNPETGQLEPL